MIDFVGAVDMPENLLIEVFLQRIAVWGLPKNYYSVSMVRAMNGQLERLGTPF